MTVALPTAGETRRAFAVRLGLANPTRGRFGKPALEAIAAAEAAGATFADPEKPAPKPKGEKAERKPRAEKPQVSQARAERPTPLAMPKRKQKVGYVVERNTVIGFTTCAVKGGCGKAVNHCACATGPVAPHYLDKGVAGTPLLLSKPVV